MRVLAMDSSSSMASAAVVDQHGLLSEVVTLAERSQLERLTTLLEVVLEQSKTLISGVDGIAVTLGPGSFTGLRIGVATANGLAQVIDKPVIGISTLEALALAVTPSCDLVVPILDARKNEVYTAIYQRTGDRLEELLPPAAMSLDQLKNELDREPTCMITLVGDGADLFHERLSVGLGSRLRPAFEQYRSVRASTVGQLALTRILDGTTRVSAQITPLYLRKAEAELNWEKRCVLQEN